MSEQSLTRSMCRAEAMPFSHQPVVFKQESDVNNTCLPEQSSMPTPPPEQPIPLPLILANTDFPGSYGFDIGFEEEKSPPTKSAQWTYSPHLDKLFMKMESIVPIQLKLQGLFSIMLMCHVPYFSQCHLSLAFKSSLQTKKVISLTKESPESWISFYHCKKEP